MIGSALSIEDIVYSIEGKPDTVVADVVPLTVHEDNAELSIIYRWGGNDCDIPYFVLNSYKGISLDRNAQL